MIKYSHRFSLGLIILAGGESSRMGHDKATLPWNGTDLLTDLLLRSQRAPFAERIVSINRDYSPKNLPAKRSPVRSAPSPTTSNTAVPWADWKQPCATANATTIWYCLSTFPFTISRRFRTFSAPFAEPPN